MKYNIEDIVQILRQLKISQIRRQLERDAKHEPERFFAVAQFITLAKEQM